MADKLFLHPSNLPIHEASIPEALVEVPAEAGEAIEEAKFEEVTDAEVGEGAKLGSGLTGKTGQTCFPSWNLRQPPPLPS